MKLVIIAGGKGTRLGMKDIPKPMVKVCGKPIIEHQIELAKRYGITDIYILSGYLSNVIIDYCGNGKKWGVNIKHIVEKLPLGTAGAIKQLGNFINDRFMVFYGDTIFDIDLSSFISYDNKYNHHIATLIVHPNDHPYDSDLVETDEYNNIVKFHSKPLLDNKYYSNLVNAALYIFSPDIFKYIKKNENSDFGKTIFPQLLDAGEKLIAYKSAEYLKDMGTLDRLAKVEADVSSAKVKRLNKEYKRKAIFIDRDGVINREVDNLRNISDFELLDNVSEAIAKINNSEFLAIAITNQPMIAKGFLSENDLNEIHKKLDTLLGYDKAYLNDLYYCPHHPDKGFVGELAHLKMNCDCRKPNVGMILQAEKTYNIDLKNSYIIGDRYVDIKAGKNAGLKTILSLTGYAGNDKNRFNIEPDKICKDLLQATEFIIGAKDDN